MNLDDHGKIIDAATPGPWSTKKLTDIDNFPLNFAIAEVGRGQGVYGQSDEYNPYGNRRFIATTDPIVAKAYWEVAKAAKRGGYINGEPGEALKTLEEVLRDK